MIMITFLFYGFKNSLDFFYKFCHDKLTVQKIEKWRIKELALVLSEIADMLRSGDNAEWANVFSHFQNESMNIISKMEFDLDALRKLITNIKNCFLGTHAFTNLALWHENTEKRTKLNQSLAFIRARLLEILNDMENRLPEHIH